MVRAYSMTESVFIGVHVSRALKAALADLAEAHEASLSQEVRAALEGHIHKWEAPLAARSHGATS